MKKFFTYFFCSLGVIFFILMCAAAYLWFVDPYHVRPLISAFTSPSLNSQAVEKETPGTPASTGTDTAPDAHPALSAEQEQALEKIGVDPATLPTTLTPEMRVCFVGILGEARVGEIQAGATPSPAEFFKARECL